MTRMDAHLRFDIRYMSHGLPKIIVCAAAAPADSVEVTKQRIQARLDAKDLTNAFHEALISTNVDLVRICTIIIYSRYS